MSKSLGGRPVLDGFDLEIQPAETFVIVGPSGAGKSVVLKHMIGLLSPDAGRVMVGDEDISDASGADLQRLRDRFGMLFQSGALLEWLSIRENVALPLRERTALGESEILEKVEATLGLVGLADDMAKHPSELSGGMRKRAGLARAIVRDPQIVLYDEPTSGLDPVSARMIDDLIERLHRNLNVTGVMVTHDLHSALSIGSRIGMLHEGKMVAVGNPQEFIRAEQQEVKRFLESQYITRRGAWERRSP